MSGGKKFPIQTDSNLRIPIVKKERHGLFINVKDAGSKSK